MPRWPGDPTGRGTSDAGEATETARTLIQDMQDPGWLTEDSQAHLGPKLAAWLTAATSWGPPELSVIDGTLVVTIEWRRSGRMRDLRADAYALIGSFAEDQTSVSQSTAESSVIYHVATGQPATETTRAHGHTVRIEVIGRGAAAAAAGTRSSTR
jgi:hypothetical protein